MSYKNSWSVEQTRRLFELAEEASKSGRGLNGVFEQVGKELSRKPGSVRNYYYAHLHTFELMPELRDKYGIKLKKAVPKPFDLFDDGEAEEFICKILIRMAKGESVRKATTELANGDLKLALRLQNKYRSIVCRQTKRARAIMEHMNSNGVTYFNPYTKTVVTKGTDTAADITDTISMLKVISEKSTDPDIALICKSLTNLALQLSSDTAVAVKDRQIAMLQAQKGILEARLDKLRLAIQPQSIKADSQTRIAEFEKYLAELNAEAAKNG